VPLAVHQFKGSRRWGWFDDSGADATADVEKGTCVVNPVATLAVTGMTVTTTGTTNTLGSVYFQLEGDFTIEVDGTKLELFVTDPDVVTALTAAIANISDIPETSITLTLQLRDPAAESRRLSSSVAMFPVYAKYVVVGLSGDVAMGLAKLQQTTETVLSEYVTHHLEAIGAAYPSAIVTYYRVGDAVNVGRDPEGATSVTTVPITDDGKSSLTANTMIVLIGLVFAVVCGCSGAVGYKLFFAGGGKDDGKHGPQANGPSEEEEPRNRNAQREDIVVDVEGEGPVAAWPAAGADADDILQSDMPPLLQHDEPGLQRTKRSETDAILLEKDMKSRFLALEAEHPDTERAHASDDISI
jgi:hypothetical protein